MVYTSQPENLEDLRRRISQECRNATPEFFPNLRKQFRFLCMYSELIIKFAEEYNWLLISFGITLRMVKSCKIKVIQVDMRFGTKLKQIFQEKLSNWIRLRLMIQLKL